MKSKLLLIAALALALGIPAFAQDETDIKPVNDQNNVPIYRVNVVARTAPAVDYRHKGDTVDLDLVGTALMPKAHGTAKVKAKRDRTTVETKLNDMEPASKFGPEYLTYVLWAITPEGRPVNLGEAQVHLRHDDNSELTTTTPLQAFGLIVTAEPYSGVTRPSDVVVMENRVPADAKANVQPIDAHYEALDRGEYRVDLNPSELPSQQADVDKNMPLELLEAENAVAIARATGADKYAADSLQKAQDFLTTAQNGYRNHQNSKDVITAARSAEQTAEDARLISIRKKREERIAEERREQQQRADEARARADAEAQRAEQARLEADRETQQRLQAEQDRQSAEQARQQAETAAQQAALERQQAEAARQQALAQQQQLAQQAQQAEQGRLAAERQMQETRDRLTQQLNSVLQTRQTARGLIVNMNDVLFDTGKATLKPGARVRLAKVAGIIMAYPDLKLEIDGYTDSIGSDELNRELSQRRADSVRSFLESQGVPNANVITHGYGKEDPIASNTTSAGRQLNRRVELVVSGNAIGMNNQPGAAGATSIQQGGTSGTATPTGQPISNQPTQPAIGGNAGSTNPQ